MTITELIDKLTEILASAGDLQVYAGWSDEPYKIEDAEACEFDFLDEDPKRVCLGAGR